MKILVANYTSTPYEYDGVAQLITGAMEPDAYSNYGSLEDMEDKLRKVSVAIGRLAEFLHSASIISDDDVRNLADGYNEMTFVRGHEADAEPLKGETDE